MTNDNMVDDDLLLDFKQKSHLIIEAMTHSFRV